MPQSTKLRVSVWLRLADVWVIVAGLVVVAVYWMPTFLAHATGFPLDDSWIYATVARNIAGGFGYSYNPGVPVSACTGFAWPYVLALFYKAFPGHPVAVGQACGVMLYLAAGLAARRLFRLVVGEGLALVGALIFVAHPFVAWGSLSGMETMATTFLVTLGLYLRLSDPSRTNRALIGGVLLSVAGLFRPEAFALLPIVELSAWIADRRAGRASHAWVRVLVWAEIVCIYALMNQTLFGSLIPNTYVAKIRLYGSFGGRTQTIATTLLVALGLYLRLSDPSRINRALIGGVLLSVAGLSRPEAFALLPIVEASAWIAERRVGRASHAWVRVLVWAEIVCVYALLNQTLLGSAIPSPYIAKIRLYGSFAGRTAWRTGIARDLWVFLATCADFIYGFAMKFVLPLSPFVVLGIAVTNRTARTVALTLLLYLGAVTVATGGVLQWGLVVTSFQGGRYYHHIVPMMVLLGLAGFDAVRRTTQQGEAGLLIKRWLPVSTLFLGVTFAAYIAMISAAGDVYATKLPKAVAAALAIVAATVLLPPLFEWARRRGYDRILASALIALSLAYVLGASVLYARFYASNVRSINDMHVAMGRWVVANVPENALVAVNDVGGIGYFGRRRVLDLTGTVSPEVLPVLLEHGDVVSVSDSGAIQVLTEARPDYVIIFPEWFPTLSSLLSTAGAPTGSCEVHRVTVVGNTVAGGDTMVVYKPDWRRLAQWLPQKR